MWGFGCLSKLFITLFPSHYSPSGNSDQHISQSKWIVKYVLNLFLDLMESLKSLSIYIRKWKIHWRWREKCTGTYFSRNSYSSFNFLFRKENTISFYYVDMHQQVRTNRFCIITHRQKRWVGMDPIVKKNLASKYIICFEKYEDMTFLLIKIEKKRKRSC